MLFSQTAEYALRAITYLADQSAGRPAGAAHIAKATAVPSSYLAKILQALAQAGIVTSHRGVHGGFELARDPAELTVLDVLNAVDPIKRIETCPLKLETHRKRLCPMHHRLDEALAHVERVLGESTISELLADPSRPRPMVETEAHR